MVLTRDHNATQVSIYSFFFTTQCHTLQQSWDCKTIQETADHSCFFQCIHQKLNFISISLGPSWFLLITSSAAFCASTLASPHQRSSISIPQMPPLAYSAHLFCLSSTSLLVPTLHLHCIADFPPKQSWWCTHFPLITTTPFPPIPS